MSAPPTAYSFEGHADHETEEAGCRQRKSSRECLRPIAQLDVMTTAWDPSLEHDLSKWDQGQWAPIDRRPPSRNICQAKPQILRSFRVGGDLPRCCAWVDDRDRSSWGVNGGQHYSDGPEGNRGQCGCSRTGHPVQIFIPDPHYELPALRTRHPLSLENVSDAIEVCLSNSVYLGTIVEEMANTGGRVIL